MVISAVILHRVALVLKCQKVRSFLSLVLFDSKVSLLKISGVGIEWMDWMRSPLYLYSALLPPPYITKFTNPTLWIHFAHDDWQTNPAATDAIVSRHPGARIYRRYIDSVKEGWGKVGHVNLFASSTGKDAWEYCRQWIEGRGVREGVGEGYVTGPKELDMIHLKGRL
jgi:hypothetical protein